MGWLGISWILLYPICLFVTFPFQGIHESHGIRFREAVFHQEQIPVVVLPPDGPDRLIRLGCDLISVTALVFLFHRSRLQLVTGL